MKKDIQKFKPKFQRIVWQPDNVTYAVGGLSEAQYVILAMVMYKLKYELVSKEKVESWADFSRLIRESSIERAEDGLPIVRTTLDELGIDIHNKEYAIRQLDELYKMTFQFPFAVFDGGQDIDNHKITITGLLADAVVSDRGNVKITLNPRMLPFLLIYGGKIGNGITKYFLEVIKGLSGRYSKSLYMILCSLATREYPHKVFDIEEFKSLMGLPPKTKNKNIGSLLKHWQKELMENADVWPEFSIIKGTGSGRCGGRPVVTAVSLYARMAKERSENRVDRPGEDDMWVNTFYAIKLLQECGYISKDYQAADLAYRISRDGKCNLISQKYQYYQKAKGNGQKNRRERARILARIVAEETSVPVDV